MDPQTAGEVLSHRFQDLPGIKSVSIDLAIPEDTTKDIIATARTDETDWKAVRVFGGLTNGRPVGEFNAVILNKLPGFMHVYSSASVTKSATGPLSTKVNAYISDTGLGKSLRNRWTLGVTKEETPRPNQSHTLSSTTGYLEVGRQGRVSGVYDIVAAPSTFAVTPPRRIFAKWTAVLKAYHAHRVMAHLSPTASASVATHPAVATKTALSAGMFVHRMQTAFGRPYRGVQASISGEAGVTHGNPMARGEAAVTAAAPLLKRLKEASPVILAGLATGKVIDAACNLHDRFHLGGATLRHFTAAGVGPHCARTPLCSDTDNPISTGVDHLGGAAYASAFGSLMVPIPVDRLADVPRVGRRLDFLKSLKGAIAGQIYGAAGVLDETLSRPLQALRTSVGVGVVMKTPTGLMEAGVGIPLLCGTHDHTSLLSYGVGLEF